MMTIFVQEHRLKDCNKEDVLMNTKALVRGLWQLILAILTLGIVIACVLLSPRPVQTFELYAEILSIQYTDTHCGVVILQTEYDNVKLIDAVSFNAATQELVKHSFEGSVIPVNLEFFSEGEYQITLRKE